jgi:hypothetical protein
VVVAAVPGGGEVDVAGGSAPRPVHPATSISVTASRPRRMDATLTPVRANPQVP